MKTFNIYKKRDGQAFTKVGEYFEDTFEIAKIKFAKNCYKDLLEGKHGDDFIEKEDGIYYNNELFFPKSNLIDGIEFFNEDVYTWEIRDSKEFLIYDEDGIFTEDVFETIEKAIEIYPSCDGYTVKEK